MDSFWLIRDWSMPEFTPHEFVSKWKQVTARERQTYQEHFIDLCRLIRYPTSMVGGPT
jgi:hypothetical protein